MDRQPHAAASRTPRLAWWCLLACLLALGLPPVAAAQAETGRVAGALSDATGAMLPGATVTLKAETTGAMTSTVTDAAGRYVFENVAPGAYEISFELAGFTRRAMRIVVAVGQPVNLETKLEIGAQAEAVQVTGTLIPRPTLEAMSPVTTLDVEELTYRGLTRMEDLLMSLPQVFAAQNSTIANGATGTATVDLRYLGSQRTLVLLDGRRMAVGDIYDVAADLNFIPSALVKRVDVLTGGASSVYGADAVAGVVNFILDRDFTGVRGGFQIGGYQHNNSNELAASMNQARGFPYPEGSVWNSAPSDFNVALGGKFADGRGHAAVYIDYRNTEAIQKDQRDYTNCAPGLGASGPICSGSPTIADGRFLVFDADYIARGDYTLDRSGAGNTFRPRRSTDVFNYAPYNFMQRPDERWAGGGFLNYEWNNHVQAYAQVMYMDDYTDAQIAPSGDFGNTSLLNCDNPMLSEQQRTLVCTNAGYGPHDIANVTILRRNVEGGGRIAQISHTSLLITGGVKGEINDVWSYDGYGLQAEMRSPASYANDLNTQRLQEALFVEGNPADPSTWACTSGNAACVPWNIFRIGGVTQEALDYLEIPLIYNSGTRTRLVNGTLTGDFKDYGWTLPSATEGIKIAVGGEYRTEYLYYDPDLAYRMYWGAGQGGPELPVSGDYDVKEFFVEGLVPLVQDASLARDLSLEVGYRYSDYSSTGGWPTFKAQASWAPVDDLKVRFGFNRATRSPNIVELYTPQGLGLNGSQDICAGPNPTATREQCARTGVTAAQYGNILANPADQYNSFDGGNPNLDPEVADTWSVGAVITPRGLPGFTAAVDYFNIAIEDTIGSLAADDIINQCAETGEAFLCSLIRRDVAGTLWLFPTGYTVTTNQNVGKVWSEGIDVNVNYLRSLGGKGSFTASLIGSYIMSTKWNTGLYEYDCVTYFGNQCGVPVPSWRHLARFSWQAPFKTTFSLGWRLLGPVTNDDGSPNTAIGDPENIELLKANDIYEIPTYNYFDLSATYQLTKNYQILAGVNNIFDKEPPLAPGMQDNDYGTGFYGTYDPLGRYFFTGLQVTF